MRNEFIKSKIKFEITWGPNNFVMTKTENGICIVYLEYA